MIHFDTQLYLDDPDGGDHLALLEVDVDLYDLEVTARENGREVELCELQIEQALFVASERIDYRKWQGLELR